MIQAMKAKSLGRKCYRRVDNTRQSFKNQNRRTFHQITNGTNTPKEKYEKEALVKKYASAK